MCVEGAGRKEFCGTFSQNAFREAGERKGFKIQNRKVITVFQCRLNGITVGFSDYLIFKKRYLLGLETA
jgi:hypothetical protein